MPFKTTTTNPGAGGANLATDIFTDSDAQQRTMPYSALAVGDIGGPYNPVDSTHPLPVAIENASLAITAAALPLPAGAATEATLAGISGTDATGISQPAGGAGIRGWLSGIYQAITGILRAKLYDAGGTNAAAVSAAGAVKVDGSAVTQPVSGTVLVSNSGFATTQSGAWTVAVSSVAGAIAATQSGAWIVSSTGTTTIGGDVASGATDSGNPVKVGGVFRQALPTFADGQRGDLQLDSHGNLKTVLQNGTLAADITQVNATAISTAEGASDAGTTRVSLGSDAGLLTFSKLSTADTNLNTIKASAGTLFRLEAFNTGAAVAYLRIYDKGTAPNPATDVPKRRYTIPAGTTGAGFVVEYLKGRPFANGIAYDITGGVSDTDTAAIAAGQVVLNADYK